MSPRLRWFALLPLLLSTALGAQQAPATAGATTAADARGRYAVGYRLLSVPDPVRTARLPSGAEPDRAVAGGRRVVAVRLWYPAADAGGAASGRAMRYEEYWATRPDSGAAPAEAAGLRDRTLGVVHYAIGKYVGADTAGVFARLAARPVLARRAARPASGRFPVVLFAGGASHTSDENVLLWEDLASHGYVVAAIASVGFGSADLPTDAAGLETMARDLELASARVERLPFADARRLGVMGFSFGGAAALVVGMRNAEVDAVVGLDPSFISSRFLPTIRRSPLYGAGHFTAALAEFHRVDPSLDLGTVDSLRYAARYVGEFRGLDHVDFNSYASLLLGLVGPRPAAAPDRPSLVARATSYEAMVRWTRQFLDAYVASGVGAGAGASALRDSLSRGPQLPDSVRTRFTFRRLAAVPAPPDPVAFEELLLTRGVAAADSLYRVVRARDPQAEMLREDVVNGIGYALMTAKRLPEALAALRWNAETYPTSTNAYDGLADAFTAMGNRDCARAAYAALLRVAPRDRATAPDQKQSLVDNAARRLGAAGSPPADRACGIPGA